MPEKCSESGGKPDAAASWKSIVDVYGNMRNRRALNTTLEMKDGKDQKEILLGRISTAGVHK